MLRIEDHEELRWLAEVAVWKGWRQSACAAASTAPDEVDETYRLMRWSTRYLAELWRPIFERRHVHMRMSGVFCHKTPLATFKDANDVSRTCELGDLLIVHDRLGLRPRRRAALMQAKRTVRGSALATDAVQNDLYRRFPPFSLSRKGHGTSQLKNGRRDVGDVDDFARFALVADDAGDRLWTGPRSLRYELSDYLPWHIRGMRPAWSVTHPKQDPVTSAGSETFGSFLAGMLFDTHPARGRTVSPILDLDAANLGDGLDLDITVQELLELTARRVAKSKRSWGGLPRGIVAFQGGTLPQSNPGSPFVDLPSLGGEGEGPPEDPREDPDDDGESISVLLIETFGG